MKNGFTLIELLAVIAILAIILLISIPAISGTITNSRINSYKSNEKLLGKAADLYLINNPDLVPINVGDVAIINYSTLASNGHISKIVDSSNGNECVNSKVYVTKLANGTYSFKNGIVCDNYISIEAFDLISGFGNFTTDSNSDGLADGFYNGNGTAFSLNNGVQTFTATSQWGCFSRDSIPYTLGQIFYGSVYVKSPSNQTGMQIGNMNGNPSGSQFHTGSNRFEFLTSRFATTVNSNASNGIRVRSWLTTGFTPIETKNMYFFNLTEIYGAGSEPSEAALDALILKSMPK